MDRRTLEPRRLARAWSPENFASQAEKTWPGRGNGEAILLHWRANLVLMAMYCIGIPLAAGFLVAFAMHLGWAVPALLGASTVLAIGGTVVSAIQLRMWLKIGGWSGRDNRPFRKAEQPGRFWAWVSAFVLIFAGRVAVAGVLLWASIFAFAHLQG